jgi:hypothetical protein
MSIEAMKQALEAMGLMGADLICEAAHHGKKDRHGIGEPCHIQQRWHKAFDALRTAIAEAEKQEPVLKPCWYESKEKTMCRKCGQVHAEAIPPAAQWVGLTDEEIEREWQFLHDEEGNPPDEHDFARAIEAAHGIGEKK